MKKTRIAALIAIALAIGILFAMAGDSSTYKTFETAYSEKGKEFHVIGELVSEREMEYNPRKDPNYFAFWMKDEDGAVRKVIYRDIKPQDFERSDKIVVTGRMQDDEFLASTILLKCPSKYIDDEIELENGSASR